MKIKSYFSSSVEKAIQQARQEMGPEAMLLTSRRSPPETRRLGAYEVVFGLPASNVAPPLSIQPVDLSQELQSLQAQLEEVKNTLWVSGRPPASTPSLPEELWRELVDADLEPSLARRIAEEAVTAWREQAQAPRSLQGGALLRQMAVESISNKLRLDAEPAPDANGSCRWIIFVGPPGAGKTTTLAKVAVQFGLATRRSLRIISVDPQRVASHEKLRALAAVLGAGFTAANSLSEFVAALEEFRLKNLILIDTPGYGGRDFEGARDIASCLMPAVNKEIDKEIHLVLPASMKRADLSRYVHQFQIFNPDYLLFTKLDETASCGAALSIALELDKPLSFFSKGQSIPEDLERASSSVLTNYLTTREPARAVSAA